MELWATQAAVRETVREFAAEEVRPVAAEADREGAFPEGVWDGLTELDLTGLTAPEEYGGFDAGRLTCAVVNEELAHGSLAVATALSIHCLATSCIAAFADEAVRVHGGYGYTAEFPVERLYRDAKVTTIYEGTTQIQKNVIARDLLE